MPFTFLRMTMGLDAELILAEPSSSSEQDATIQFLHQRFVSPDFPKPESGDHPEIAPFLTEEPVSLSAP
jgi:hypothetical protein